MRMSDWISAGCSSDLVMNLVLVARRAQRLEELAERFANQYGVQTTICALDLAAPTAAQRVLDATASLDVGLLVSNAGFGLKGSHADNDVTAMTEMLMVNCHVPMQLARGFIPRLLARGQGGIVFTSSVEAFIGCPYSTAYSANKAFVNHLGEGLRAELRPEEHPSELQSLMRHP